MHVKILTPRLTFAIICILALAFQSNALAQAEATNEAAPIGKVRALLNLPDSVTGSAKVGLSDVSSAVDSLSFSGDFLLNYTVDNANWFMSAQRQFSETSTKVNGTAIRQTAVNNYSINGGVIYQLNDRLSLKTRAGFYSNSVKAIDRDTSIFTLPIFRVWDSPRGELLLGGGVGYRQKKVELADSTFATESAFAYGVYNEFKYQITKTFGYSQTLLAYSNFSSPSNHALEFTAGFAQSLTSNLKLVLQYQTSYHEQTIRPDLEDHTRQIQIQLEYAL